MFDLMEKNLGQLNNIFLFDTFVSEELFSNYINVLGKKIQIQK